MLTFLNGLLSGANMQLKAQHRLIANPFTPDMPSHPIMLGLGGDNDWTASTIYRRQERLSDDEAVSTTDPPSQFGGLLDATRRASRRASHAAEQGGVLEQGAASEPPVHPVMRRAPADGQAAVQRAVFESLLIQKQAAIDELSKLLELERKKVGELEKRLRRRSFRFPDGWAAHRGLAGDPFVSDEAVAVMAEKGHKKRPSDEGIDA